jgi:23S rRNA-/tRNA-specific pseudouridylate synthase
MTQMMPDALESRTISIPGDGRRLDVALSEAAGLTRSRVAALMADGNVTVDGKVETKSGAKAKPGQTVVLMIPAPKPTNSEPTSDATSWEEISSGNIGANGSSSAYTAE